MIKIACCEVQPTRSECKTRKGGIRYSLIPLTAPNRQGAEFGIPSSRPLLRTGRGRNSVFPHPAHCSEQAGGGIRYSSYRIEAQHIYCCKSGSELDCASHMHCLKLVISTQDPHEQALQKEGQLSRSATSTVCQTAFTECGQVAYQNLTHSLKVMCNITRVLILDSFPFL